jgi:hypothetical protein
MKKFSKYCLFGILAVGLMMTDEIHVDVDSGELIVGLGITAAMADEGRRVARRTARRTSSRN